MSVQQSLSDLIDYAMSNTTLVGAAVAVAVIMAGTASGFFINKRRLRELMRLKMVARGQRSKQDMEILRTKLRSLQINNKIPTWSFQELHTALQNGQVTATDVLCAYQLKALEVNDKTNAVTDFIKSAADIAAQLDKLPAAERGPLHGIPISLKESVGIEGLDCTCGFGELIDIPMEKDSSLLQVLKAKGAVPFIRTNLPQGMRSQRTVNGIFGETHNPYNVERTPSGSSGGEGAIIGGQGSILGVGSDLAGSARFPANFCGIASLKPTAGRLGQNGNFNASTMNGQNIIPITEAPMGRDVTSLVQFMRSVLGHDLWEIEPAVPPMLFNEEMFGSTRPLRIGYSLSDNNIRPVPAVQRAVKLAVSSLQAAGHQLIPFDVKDYTYRSLVEFVLPLVTADQGKGYDELLRNDRTCQQMLNFWDVCKLPDFLRPLVAKLARMKKDFCTADFLANKPIRTITDWQRTALDVEEFKESFAAHWKKHDLDILISPVWPSPANTPEVVSEMLACASNGSLWNVLNYPAGSVPVTKMTAKDVEMTKDVTFYPAASLQETMIRDDIDGTEGLPISVQVVGLPYTEETVLRIMADIEAQIMM